MKAITLLGIVIHLSICCIGYTNEKSIVSYPKHDTIGSPKERAIEISKIGYNKTFLLKKGRDVWMYFPNEKGKLKVKRAQITGIDENEITVKPYNKKFNEKVYSDSDITFIGFTSAGRIIIAVIGTILLLIPMIILALLTGYGDIVLIPYRKNINLEQRKNGTRKWDLGIVEAQN
ncbi:MAG TPA: hypothetical protein VFT15_15335 [Chitinophagaceae bacterium]|nr:hypothetical protein [Chitinophagaceae bacterium]